MRNRTKISVSVDNNTVNKVNDALKKKIVNEINQGNVKRSSFSSFVNNLIDIGLSNHGPSEEEQKPDNYTEKSKKSFALSIKQLIQDHLPLVYIDQSFQRRVCWSPEDQKQYIIGVINRDDASPFVFADVPSGIARSEHEGHESSKSRFEKVKNLNKEYISIDGQNRSQALMDYVDDKFGVTCKITHNGETYDLKHCKYSELPDAIRGRFDSEETYIVLHTYALYDNLSVSFQKINSGVPQNRMEKRNSLITWIAGYLRECAEKKYPEFLKRVITEDEHKRMLDIELLLKMLVVTHKDFNWASTGADTLDLFYALGTGGKTRNLVNEYHSKHMDRFLKIMDMVVDVLGKPKHSNLQKNDGSLPKTMMWATVLICEYLVDNGLKFKGELTESPDELIYKLDRLLNDDHQQNYAAAIQLWKSNGSKDGEDPSERDYYQWWRNRPHQFSPTTKRKQLLIDKFKELHVDKIIKQQPKLALVEGAQN